MKKSSLVLFVVFLGVLNFLFLFGSDQLSLGFNKMGENVSESQKALSFEGFGDIDSVDVIGKEGSWGHEEKQVLSPQELFKKEQVLKNRTELMMKQYPKELEDVIRALYNNVKSSNFELEDFLNMINKNLDKQSMREYLSTLEGLNQEQQIILVERMLNYIVELNQRQEIASRKDEMITTPENDDENY